VDVKKGGLKTAFFEVTVTCFISHLILHLYTDFEKWRKAR